MFSQHSKLVYVWTPLIKGGGGGSWTCRLVSDSPPPSGCRGSRPPLTREPRGSLGRTGGTLPAAKRLCIYHHLLPGTHGNSVLFFATRKKKKCAEMLCFGTLYSVCWIGRGSKLIPAFTVGSTWMARLRVKDAYINT